jgi:hypothetical protein
MSKIKIQVGTYLTFINIVDGLPNYSGVPSYALPALQQAFADGNYEIVPDLEPVVEPPTPNWDGFNSYMLTDTDFNTYYGTGLTVAPAVTTSIPTALAQVSTNGVNSFNLTFNGFCNAVSVTTTHRNSWADVAESYHLPADFVSVIRGGN